MKALKLAILITVFIPAIGKAKDNDVRVKAHFLNAKQRLENMLTGKEAMSFEEAIYQIENAWYEGRIDRSSFDEVVTHHIANIRELVNGHADEEELNPVTDLKGTKEQKLKNYRTSLINYAIYNYMTTSSLWVDENNLFLHKPYQYSRQDPMGTWDWTNTQVTHLLNESNGNCFALAALFRIFSERLNSDAKLCTAPGHIYIRHANEKGTHYNVELSSRSFPGTGTIETLTYTPNEATKNNISLRELDLKQSVALCLVYLAKGYEHKLGIKDDDFMLACAETALQFDERNLNAMLLKAEVLESRLLAHNQDIRLLKKHPAFNEYQQWLTHIFSLGYREMPFEMKNTLLKGWTRDTILQLAATDHTPKRTDHPNLMPARYASLSWGLFDEEIKTKPFERYGNTVFDTRKKEIAAFLQEDILYNQYNFDPVVFAWNVDPMAHKFPHASPYNFVENNPISRVDPDGNEWVNAYDAIVSMWEAKAKTSPTDKSVQRNLAFFRDKQADVNKMLGEVKKNDPALYDYIDNLKYTRTNSNGDKVERNIQVVVGTDNGISGNAGQVGQTENYINPGFTGDYNGNQITLPLARTPSGKKVVGFNVTIYGAEGSNYRDGALANEAGDVMYFMEYNPDALSKGSDNPQSESYFKAGGKGEYSSRVEHTYLDRKKSTTKGNTPSDNPYPLPKK